MTKKDLSSRHFQRKISEFCELRIAPITSKRVLENVRPYLLGLIIYRKSPPFLNGHIDWTTIGQSCGIEAELTAELKKATAARLGCNHSMARGTTGSRRATVLKAKDPPEQNSVCKEGSLHILDQKAPTRDNRRYICPVCVCTAWTCTEADQSFPGTAIPSDRRSGKLSGCVGLSYAPVRGHLLATLPRSGSSE